MAEVKKKTTTKTTKQTEVVKTVAELQKDLDTKRQDLIEAKRSHKAGELVNPRVLVETRREIARILTAIRAEEKKEA